MFHDRFLLSPPDFMTDPSETHELLAVIALSRFQFAIPKDEWGVFGIWPKIRKICLLDGGTTVLFQYLASFSALFTDSL